MRRRRAFRGSNAEAVDGWRQSECAVSIPEQLRFPSTVQAVFCRESPTVHGYRRPRDLAASNSKPFRLSSGANPDEPQVAVRNTGGESRDPGVGSKGCGAVVSNWPCYSARNRDRECVGAGGNGPNQRILPRSEERRVGKE